MADSTTKVHGFGPLPAQSRIMVVGDWPHSGDVERRKPFTDRNGWLLDSLLSQVGIGRQGCYVTNVCKYCPPPNSSPSPIDEWWTNNAAKAKRNKLTHRHGDYWLEPRVVEGLAELPQEIEYARPEVIVALGNLALWALTGESGIGNWRGSEMWYAGSPVPGPWDFAFKRKKDEPAQPVAEARVGTPAEPVAVVPTYHPAYVLRVWEWKAAVLQDLRRRVVGKLMRPEERREPEYRINVQTNFGNAMMALAYLRDALGDTVPLVCDVETRRCRLAVVGFGWSRRDALVIPIMHVDGTRVWPPHEEREIIGAMRPLLCEGKHPVGNQNFNYDRQYFWADPAFGFRPRMDFDTMIAQHLFLPGTPKDLAYLASLYCAWYRFWKEDGKEVNDAVDEERWWWYNGLDCVNTWEVWGVQQQLLKEAGLA